MDWKNDETERDKYGNSTRKACSDSSVEEEN